MITQSEPNREATEEAQQVLNRTYAEYTEYQEWLNSRGMGRLLNQLMMQWRHHKLKFLPTPEELEHAHESAYRASGDCICPVCGEQYRKHPTVVRAEWLNRLCNGEYVKL